MQQQVRMSHGKSETNYVLKAKPMSARVGRKEAALAAEQAIESAMLPSLSTPDQVLAHLQKQSTLKIVNHELSERLKTLQKVAKNSVPRVTLTPL